jgi:hypothetical protein
MLEVMDASAREGEAGYVTRLIQATGAPARPTGSAQQAPAPEA